MRRVVVLGTGSVGGFVGGSLAWAGASVGFIGRPAVIERIIEQGIALSDRCGWQAEVPATSICTAVAGSPAAVALLAQADLILLAVKSQDSDSVVSTLQTVPITVPIVSLQNGVGNVPALRRWLPQHRILRAMVPFNILQLPPSRWHRGSEGELCVEPDPFWGEWQPVFAQARLPLQQDRAIEARQWGKLLVNLNNSVNALSGVTLRDEFSQAGYRRVLAAAIEEGMVLLRQAGIAYRSPLRAPLPLLVHVLRWPDSGYRRWGHHALRVDAEARSSMWEDLQRGRRTEVDAINGELLRLADRLGLPAPVNRYLVDAISLAERSPYRPIDAATLWQAVREHSSSIQR